MFNSTHTFVAFAIARTGLEKWSPRATATAVIASNLPDIDSVAGFWGTATYLDHHRGITHTLIGVPILAALFSAVMYFFSGNFGRTFAVSLIAMATHPALDYLNSYGLRPFLPWDNTWYYGDLVFIIDPYLDAILLLGIVAGTEKLNVRRLAAWLSIAAALAYVGVRIQLHGMAEEKLGNFLSSVRAPVKMAALPEILNPFVWDGITDTDGDAEKFRVDILSRIDHLPREAPPHGFTGSAADSASPGVIAQAAASQSAAAFFRFARFPVSRVEQSPEGYRVTFMDFRFYRSGGDTALAAEIILDESLKVVRESLSFAHRIE